MRFILPFLLVGCGSMSVNVDAHYRSEASAVMASGCEATANGCRVMPINIVVLTEHAGRFDRSDAEAEVAILDQYFRTQTGHRILQFELAGFSPHSALPSDSRCDVATLGSPTMQHTAKNIAAFRDCDDLRIVDPTAINLFVVDSQTVESTGQVTDTVNSLGYANDGRPFLLLDHTRLGHTLQGPEEHEMGHALGLGHVCEDPNDSTNVMASGTNCHFDGTPDRTVGFYDSQVASILAHADAVGNE